jgi:hypothetical protein
MLHPGLGARRCLPARRTPQRHTAPRLLRHCHCAACRRSLSLRLLSVATYTLVLRLSPLLPVSPAAACCALDAAAARWCCESSRRRRRDGACRAALAPPRSWPLATAARLRGGACWTLRCRSPPPHGAAGARSRHPACGEDGALCACHARPPWRRARSAARFRRYIAAAAAAHCSFPLHHLSSSRSQPTPSL